MDNDDDQCEHSNCFVPMYLLQNNYVCDELMTVCNFTVGRNAFVIDFKPTLLKSIFFFFIIIFQTFDF